MPSSSVVKLLFSPSWLVTFSYSSTSFTLWVVVILLLQLFQTELVIMQLVVATTIQWQQQQMVKLCLELLLSPLFQMSLVLWKWSVNGHVHRQLAASSNPMHFACMTKQSSFGHRYNNVFLPSSCYCCPFLETIFFWALLCYGYPCILVLSFYSATHIVCFCSWVWKKQHNNHFSSYMQAEARLLVVGVMGKILNSDSRGVSATLLERMNEATTQVQF